MARAHPAAGHAARYGARRIWRWVWGESVSVASDASKPEATCDAQLEIKRARSPGIHPPMKKRPAVSGGASSNNRVGLCQREVFGADLAAHFVGLQFEIDLLTIIEAGQTGALDGADVNEHILAAIVRLNEAVALLTVEPLHGTCRHLTS